MIKGFNDKFTIMIDTSACTSCISGHSTELNDTWYYKDLTFESGKIYGLVSEYGLGCEYLSYFLGGRIEFEEVRVCCSGTPISRQDLCDVSWNLEPSREPYGKYQVKRSIEKALSRRSDTMSFQDIAGRFLLTEERYSRKFTELSGERWRASSAYGYAQNKRIYFAPYNSSAFYARMCSSNLLKALHELTDSGALVVLPVGSDEFIKHIADEVIYLGKSYNIAELKNFNTAFFGEDWVH